MHGKNKAAYRWMMAVLLVCVLVMTLMTETPAAAAEPTRIENWDQLYEQIRYHGLERNPEFSFDFSPSMNITGCSIVYLPEMEIFLSFGDKLAHIFGGIIPLTRGYRNTKLRSVRNSIQVILVYIVPVLFVPEQNADCQDQRNNTDTDDLIMSGYKSSHLLPPLMYAILHPLHVYSPSSFMLKASLTLFSLPLF